VDPTRLEPLTSAVQKRIHNVVVVRRCSKIAANKHILSYRLTWMFSVVRLGWCQFGVNWLRVCSYLNIPIMAFFFNRAADLGPMRGVGA
jgi:hypothetical protein